MLVKLAKYVQIQQICAGILKYTSVSSIRFWSLIEILPARGSNSTKTITENNKIIARQMRRVTCFFEVQVR